MDTFTYSELVRRFTSAQSVHYIYTRISSMELKTTRGQTLETARREQLYLEIRRSNDSERLCVYS